MCRCVNRLTEKASQPYSGGMISEFHDLSDKIDRLAELTLSLRRENAALRQSNALLSAENANCHARLAAAQQRVETLLATLPDADAEAARDDQPSDIDNEAVQ